MHDPQVLFSLRHYYSLRDHLACPHDCKASSKVQSTVVKTLARSVDWAFDDMGYSHLVVTTTWFRQNSELWGEPKIQNPIMLAKGLTFASNLLARVDELRRIPELLLMLPSS